jgi:hypothetical protein
MCFFTLSNQRDKRSCLWKSLSRWSRFTSGPWKITPSKGRRPSPPAFRGRGFGFIRVLRRFARRRGNRMRGHSRRWPDSRRRTSRGNRVSGIAWAGPNPWRRPPRGNRMSRHSRTRPDPGQSRRRIIDRRGRRGTSRHWSPTDAHLRVSHCTNDSNRYSCH